MKKLALACAAIAVVTVTAAAPASAQDVRLRVGPAHRAHAAVVVRHDRGWHRGWEHRRHHRAIVIRHR
jgi:hypothetical protein